MEYITEVLDGTVTAEQYGEPQGRITVLTEPVEEGLPFTDVAEGAWYYDYIVTAYEDGLMVGVSDTEFDPDGSATRAMVATVLARLVNTDTVDAAA